MKLVVVFLFVLAVVLGTPLDLKELRTLTKDKEISEKESPSTIPLAPSLPQNKAGYSFAVDISTPASVSNFQCLTTNGYLAAFIRVYAPTGSGTVDTAGITSVQNAATAKIGTEVYVTPQVLGSKQGYQQFDETYTALTNRGVSLRTIWLQVTSPVNWQTSQQSNINFITSFVQRALQYGVTPGIYTNTYDWQQITSSWTGLSSYGTVYLWYWHVLGQGVSGESSPDFSDFRSFGSWSVANVKQFAQSENLCGLTVNRDVYPANFKSHALKAVSKDSKDKIQVGCVFSNC
jgi:hypothetical protein